MHRGRPAAWLYPLCLLLLTLAAGSLAGALPFTDRTADLCPGLGNGQACWADLNADGLTDLCAGGVAYTNNPGRAFTKLAEGLGAVVAADYDNDGYTDLFSWSKLQVLHNDGGKGFTPLKLPELPKCVSRGACWGDFNGDGFADLYVGGYEDWDAGVTYPNMILRNEGGTSFRLIWTETRYRSRGVTACDFDEDGDLDIYVSDYRLQPNMLWVNDGKGNFTDEAADYGAIATSAGFEGGHSIGAAWGDFNNDGLFDLFAGNFAHVDSRGDQPKSRFLRNLGPGERYTFRDLGTCGIHYQESYASPAAGDYDNDGNLDLLFTTVYGTASFGRPNFPVLFRNLGGVLVHDETEAAGLSGLAPTYQAAWADFDQDGDLDLCTAGKLFVNEGNGGGPAEARPVRGGTHWLEVRLQGDGKQVNRSAIGAQARVKLRSHTLSRQVEAGTGEGNQNDLTLHFGLRVQERPVTLEIRWPGGKLQTLTEVPVDRLLTVAYQ